MLRKYFQVSFYILLSLLVFALNGCANQEQKEERLAKKYCSTCHKFPEPTLLEKKSWTNKVLPEMAFLMGLDVSQKLLSLSVPEINEIVKTLPEEPSITIEEWQHIVNYYSRLAPDSIPKQAKIPMDTISSFSKEEIDIRNSMHSVLSISTNTILSGNMFGKIHVLDNVFNQTDSILFTKPASFIRIKNKTKINILLTGQMYPNDEKSGSLIEYDLTTKTQRTILDSLKHPVYMDTVDLNNDNITDYVLCNYGNFTGDLTAFEGKPDGTFEPHTLLPAPGAKKVIVHDFDLNGYADIIVLMARGDEQITLLSNHGKFSFKINKLLRFPPGYGSSDFALEDFNKDGKLDILYTHGDNSKHFLSNKPYHGVRLFLNNGKNEFNEEWFYPLYGAYKSLVHDFDLDGDLDIATIAFFADFKNSPENSFVYFNNKTEINFTPERTLHSTAARWYSIEKGDIDNDGDVDILLGGLNFESGVPASLSKKWKEKTTSILLLRNKKI